MADKKVKPATPAPVVKEPVEPTPADIKDKLQTMKNEKAAKQWEETNKAKGGCIKMAKGGSASARADGCAIRGKTRG